MPIAAVFASSFDLRDMTASGNGVFKFPDRIMPRSSRHRLAKKPRKQTTLETLAILLFSTIEDDDDELVAIALAAIALEDRNKRSAKYGPRGIYDREKSKDFFDLIIYNYTERQFKRWLRSVLDLIILH